ncbi:MAG: MDR/zinc-dependent alcohol dehydrogenase-like family protein [Solirubrobacteraceae bacterium]
MAAVSPRRADGGAQAELLVVPAPSLIGIPPGASLAQASTLPMNGLTAMRGLELLDLRPGQTLAVTGGVGLLASYVVPLAKERGILVIADARPEDEDLVRSFGPDHLVPRGDGFIEGVRSAVPEGVDAVFDTALLGEQALPAIREQGASRERAGFSCGWLASIPSTRWPRRSRRWPPGACADGPCWSSELDRTELEEAGVAMSKANVQLARCGYDALVLARGDFDELAGLLDPRSALAWRRSRCPRRMRGREQVLVFLHQAIDRNAVGELVDVIEADDCVVVVMQPLGGDG